MWSGKAIDPKVRRRLLYRLNSAFAFDSFLRPGARAASSLNSQLLPGLAKSEYSGL
jgi:hypothetical protein